MVSDLGGAKVLCMGHKIFLAYIDRSWNLSENFWWATKSFRFTFPSLCCWKLTTLSKKNLRHKRFPVNLAEFFSTPSLQKTSKWLLLPLSFYKFHLKAYNGSLLKQALAHYHNNDLKKLCQILWRYFLHFENQKILKTHWMVYTFKYLMKLNTMQV